MRVELNQIFTLKGLTSYL